MSTSKVIDWKALPATLDEFISLYGDLFVGDSPVIHPDDHADVLDALSAKAKADPKWEHLYTFVQADIFQYQQTHGDSDSDASFNSLLIETVDTIEITENQLNRLNKAFVSPHDCNNLDDYIWLYQQVKLCSSSTQLRYAVNLDSIVNNVHKGNVLLDSQNVAAAAIASRKIKKRHQSAPSPKRHCVFVDLTE